MNQRQMERYIYDKIFRQEITEGQPAFTIIDKSYSLIYNKRILSDIRDAMQNYPTYTLDQYKSLFKKTFHVRFIRYFKDFELKQTNLPINESLIKDTYIGLWGKPREARFRGGDERDLNLVYQPNLLEITKKLLTNHPNKTLPYYISIIERDEPVFAEKLLKYLDKWKHITQDKTFNNNNKLQNIFTETRINNRRHHHLEQGRK